MLENLETMICPPVPEIAKPMRSASLEQHRHSTIGAYLHVETFGAATNENSGTVTAGVNFKRDTTVITDSSGNCESSRLIPILSAISIVGIQALKDALNDWYI